MLHTDDVIKDLKNQIEENEKKLKDSEEVLDDVSDDIEGQGAEDESDGQGDEDDDARSGQEDADDGDDDGEEEQQLSDAEKKKQHFKNRQELKEERKKRQELEERLRQLELMAAQNTGFQKAWEQSVAPKQVEENKDPEPDADLYPEEHTAWLVRQQANSISQQSEALKQMQKRIELQDELRGVQVLEAQYRNQNPGSNYDDAMNYYFEREANIMRLRNPEATPEQIRNNIEMQKLEIFRNGVMRGVNPAEIVVQMAESYGYTGAKQKDTPKKKTDFKKVTDNMRRNKSLIGGSSATDGKGIATPDDVFNTSLTKLAKMGKDEYREFFDSAYKNI